MDILTVGLPSLISGLIFMWAMSRILPKANIVIPPARPTIRLAMFSLVLLFFLFYIPVFIDRVADGRDLFHNSLFITQFWSFWLGVLIGQWYHTRSG